MKIISGGQTGADRGALIAAKEAGFQTGGWMPKGFIAQDGMHPEFAELYGMKETESPKYAPRTALNVRDSDVTIRIATNFNSPGEILTKTIIDRYNRPFFDIDPLDDSIMPEMVAEWIKENNAEVINVAGNSEKSSKGITEFTIAFMSEVLMVL